MAGRGAVVGCGSAVIAAAGRAGCVTKCPRVSAMERVRRNGSGGRRRRHMGRRVSRESDGNVDNLRRRRAVLFVIPGTADPVYRNDDVRATTARLTIIATGAGAKFRKNVNSRGRVASRALFVQMRRHTRGNVSCLCAQRKTVDERTGGEESNRRRRRAIV